MTNSTNEETPTQMVARIDAIWPYIKNPLAMELAVRLEAAEQVNERLMVQLRAMDQQS